jgi:hypothetical protein
MSYKDPTYVIFDGDKDQWAYRYMRGWKASEHLDFDFRDAHDLTSMTARAANEAYVKSQLRDRMSKAKQVIVIVGESTKNLRKFVAWEIELAKEKGLPIVVVNLKSGQRRMDPDLCPLALRDYCGLAARRSHAHRRRSFDQSSSASRFTAGASGDVAEVRGLGCAGAWVKHSPPKRLRNASAVAVSGKQNRI